MKWYSVIPRFLQIFFWPIAHFILRINGTFSVKGLEHLHGIRGPVIFASNHINELDPVVQAASLPIFSHFKPLFWVARMRSEYTWKGWRRFVYGDWFFKAFGAWPAYKGHQDYEQSLRHHINILKDGYSVGMFPQGTMGVKDGLTVEELKKVPARGGVAFLASHTKTPIVPMVIRGTRNINAWKLLIKKTSIEIEVLPPVFLSEKEINYKEKAQEVMDQINAVS